MKSKETSTKLATYVSIAIRNCWLPTLQAALPSICVC